VDAQGVDVTAGPAGWGLARTRWTGWQDRRGKGAETGQGDEW